MLVRRWSVDTEISAGRFTASIEARSYAGLESAAPATELFSIVRR